MTKRILKRIRNFRVLSGLLIASLTILSFQNCAPQNAGCSDGSSSCSTEGSISSPSSDKDSIWDSRPGRGSPSGVTVGSGSGSGGSVSVGSGSSGRGTGGGITIGSGGSGSSSGGGTSSGGGVSVGGGGGSGSNNDTSFRITKQPESVVVPEKENFNLTIGLAGGTGPYTYQWYKDNVAISNGMGTYSSYYDTASSFGKEGDYYVVATDAKGQTVQSSRVRVTVQELAGTCNAGSYFTYTSGQFDTGYRYIPEYFESPRGKFLLHSSYDTNGMAYQYASYFHLSSYNVPTTLPYMGKTYINCRTEIPRIHTPQPNPTWNSYDYGYYNRFDDNAQYNYQGNITFECHNKRLKLISNTCTWVKNPNYVPDYGGGG